MKIVVGLTPDYIRIHIPSNSTEEKLLAELYLLI